MCPGGKSSESQTSMKSTALSRWALLGKCMGWLKMTVWLLHRGAADSQSWGDQTGSGEMDCALDHSPRCEGRLYREGDFGQHRSFSSWRLVVTYEHLQWTRTRLQHHRAAGSSALCSSWSCRGAVRTSAPPGQCLSVKINRSITHY